MLTRLMDMFVTVSLDTEELAVKRVSIVLEPFKYSKISRYYEDLKRSVA